MKLSTFNLSFTKPWKSSFLFLRIFLACTCAQLGLTLCHPMDCRLPGPGVHVFFRQEYWTGLPFPSPRDFSDQGTQPASLVSPELAGGFFTTGTAWEALFCSVLFFVEGAYLELII